MVRRSSRQVSRWLLATGLLAWCAFAGWPWAAPTAQAQAPPITVEGQIANGTAGADDIEGLTVVFHQHLGAVQDDLEAVSDAEGRFLFEGISFDPEIAYGVSVTYIGVLYGVDLDLSGGSPPFVLLTVYEPADSPEILSVSSASVLFLEPEEPGRGVSTLEITRIVNSSDRSFVPGTQPMDLLRFGLPPGAQDLQVETALPEADYVQVDRGFAILSSVPPGEHEVMFTYRFPYTGTGATFTKSLPFGAESLRALAPLGVVELSSAELGNPRRTTVGETSYQLLEASGLPRGATVTLTLGGLPESLTVTGTSVDLEGPPRGIRFEYMGPVALGLVMVAVITFALTRRYVRKREGAGDVAGPPADGSAGP